jgi:isopenicillin-N N-acyltransferase-like protein
MSRGLQRVVASGGPLARGRAYGRQAADKVRRCIAAYRDAFQHRAGLAWDEALARARGFEDDIAVFSPIALLEMRGIAEGAGADFDAILALNCRSELMFAAAQRGAVPSECTSFAVAPEASADGHMLLGQNWDWVPFAREVCVLVEMRRDDGPDFATVVEAGMLAKVGFNSAGLGLCTNTLVSSKDAARHGVPYHVMLRSLLDAESVAGAERILTSVERALSANYLVADKFGAAANFETIAGGAGAVRTTRPTRGLLAHSNHFLDPEFAPIDAYVGNSPHSLTRLDAMRRGLAGSGLSVARLKEILRDHEHAPNGVCSHPDPKAHPLYARTTVASVVADLTAGEMWVTEGPPCGAEYQNYSLPRTAAVSTP